MIINTSEYNEEDISILELLVESDANQTVKELNLSGQDALIAFDMIYKQIFREKYNIDM